MRKNLKILCLMVFVYHYSMAQTNEFPPSGPVGVGTTSPTSHFYAGSLINLKSNGNSEIIFDHSDGGTSSDIGILSFERNNDHLAHIRVGHDGNTDSAFLSFHAQPSGGAFFNLNSNEHMRIKSNGFVGVGTTTPTVKLDIEGGDLYVGEEVSSNGRRRQIRVYGFDSGSKFYGSMHANYDDSKRTFDISTNNQTQQIKIDASAYATSNIILYPGSFGYVGIGTTTPDEKLSVNGNIHTKEVRVDLIGWSDFVFNDDYKLPTLQEVENHIKDKGHLKDIPSAREVAENGILLGEMDSKLLQKIEELMLYTIEQQKQIEIFKKELRNQKYVNESLKERLQQLVEVLETKN